MKKQERTREELIKELQELKQENQTLRTKYISEQKQAEDAYSESESKYRVLFESANDAIFLLDKHLFIDCNLKTLELFGCTKAQIIGQPPFEFSPEHQPDGQNSITKAEKYINDALNGKPQLFEWKHKRHDGTLFDAEVSLNLFHSSGHNLILAIVRNITDRKLIEKTMHDSHEELNITLRSIGDAVIVTDIDGLVTYLNPIAENLTGWNFIKAKGQPLDKVFKIINANSRKRMESPFSTVIRTGKIVGLANHTILISRSGTEYQIADSAAPLLDYEGRIRGVVLVFRDVTDEYIRDEKLRLSEQLYRTIFESTGTAAIIIEEDTTIALANNEWVNLSGYSNEELEGKMSWTEFVVEEDLERMVSFHKKRRELNNISPRKYEFRFRCRNGEIRYMINCVNMIPGTNKSIASLMDITERKQAENALFEREINLRLLLELAPDAFFQGDENGFFIQGNKRAVSLTGYTLEELLTMNIEELFTPSLLDQKPLRYDLLNKGETIIQERELLRKDGTIRIVEMNSRKMPDRTYQTFVRDITERKLAEETIRKSNELLSLFMKYSPIYAYMKRVTSKENRVLMASDNFINMIGIQASDMIGKTMHELFPKELADQITADDWNVVSKGEMLEIEEELNGRYYHTIKFPISYGDKNLLAGYTIDITDSKKAEEALSESEARFKTIFMKSPIGISLSDSLTGEILQANPRYAEIIGRSLEETLTMNWMDITHPEDILIDQEKNSLLLQGIIPSYQMEKRYIHSDGSIIWVNMTIVPLSEELYDHPHNLCMIEDITDKKNYELELIKAKEKAEESDRLKSAFLANMSHEIRTPMNGILGFSSLLKESNLTGEQQQEYIKVIEKSGHRMLNIINDIIDISKIEAGLMLINKKEVNISELIDALYHFFKPEAEGKGLQLIVKNKLPTEESVIHTDREKVNSILTNLIKNAIKFTSEGSIEIGCKRKSDILEFYVKDTGIGIPANRQKAIFERFIQADIEDNRAWQGAGLGLAISKAYVEMLGGHIGVVSDPFSENKGSIFYFTLPYDAKPTADKEEDLEIPAVNVEKTKGLKILIAEDDDMSEMLINQGVKAISKEILNARTGFEAVELCRKHPDIDLILMDIQMPVMNGYVAVKQIRQFNKEVVIFAQTAFALAGDREKAMEAGCNDYISKPIDNQLLLAKIQKSFTK